MKFNILTKIRHENLKGLTRNICLGRIVKRYLCLFSTHYTILARSSVLH